MELQSIFRIAALVVLIATVAITAHAQGPALTTISGTVYRADGTTASGTALIAWPSFRTAGGDAVAAGNMSVVLGPLGALTAQLVPNVGATPAGTYYVVVFQLDDATVRKEYWAVPSTSPTTIVAVRTTPGNGLGNLAATQDYVTAEVANRALDASVVHLAGAETIVGTKQFALPPAFPPPSGASDGATKGYVDTAVSNFGSGAFVAKAGDTMSGPLTLPSDPASPNQAANRHYVDTGLASKADLVNNKVPTGELGAGVASAATCLNGNSTWGSCGGGGNVSSVFGRTGTVVASSGDYSVSQISGAAVDASVVHNTGAETIAGAKTFTGNVTASANLILPQGSAYIPAVGGMGLDTTVALPVVNIGGTTHQVAFTSSNISGQAGTALALAAAPTQCSGAFATGIAANGNANCTTPNVIQLSETTQPTGIPNWGIFWFDSATHTPRVIENNGQVTQLGLTNLFNSDPGGNPADNLEQRNGSNGQSFRVYSSFTNNTSWQRTSLGYDATDNYAVLRSENATSASAPGLGFWIGSGLKWVVDASGILKPWTDNTFSLGSDSGNAPKSVFAKTSFNSVVNGRNDFEIPNDAPTGTVVNELAIFNSNSPSQAVVAGTSSTNGVIGVVQGGAGKTGNAVVTWRGYAYCSFDNATTAGDAVVASTTTAGQCHDTGSTAQPTAQLIGRVDVTNATLGQTNGIRVSLQPAQGGGNVASVFGRSGTVIATTGDYSVGQITGAAADSAVVHLTGTETISGVKTFSSNITLNGNLNVAGNINQTGTGPTQWSGKEWAGTTVTVPSGMEFSLGVGSDHTFKCQLTSGTSCMPTSPVTNCAWVTMPTQSGSGNAFSGTNKAIVWGVYNPYPCISNSVAYVVGTADNTSNNYALGLYSGSSGGSGTLIATTASIAGTTFAPSTGIKHISWNASNVSVPAGRVYIALTSNCASSCGALLGSPGSGVTWAANLQVSVTTGGAALPATVTLPSDSFSSGASIPALIVY